VQQFRANCRHLLDFWHALKAAVRRGEDAQHGNLDAEQQLLAGIPLWSNSMLMTIHGTKMRSHSGGSRGRSCSSQGPLAACRICVVRHLPRRSSSPRHGFRVVAAGHAVVIARLFVAPAARSGRQCGKHAAAIFEPSAGSCVLHRHLARHGDAAGLHHWLGFVRPCEKTRFAQDPHGLLVKVCASRQRHCLEAPWDAKPARQRGSIDAWRAHAVLGFRVEQADH
jgi:hypothetical protein